MVGGGPENGGILGEGGCGIGGVGEELGDAAIEQVDAGLKPATGLKKILEFRGFRHSQNLRRIYEAGLRKIGDWRRILLVFGRVGCFTGELVIVGKLGKAQESR